MKGIQLLALNILPLFKTVLHHCSKKQYIVNSIYQAQEKAKAIGQDFFIPFLKNYKGESPIHKCMKYDNHKIADLFLRNIMSEGIDSHGKEIYDILPAFIEENIPSVGVYLDNRLLQTDLLKNLKRGSVKY